MVTGAAHGIGQGIARALCGEGARVFGVDIDRAGLEQLAAQLAGLGFDFQPLQADVSKPADIQAAIAQALARGPIDVLVNNAGINMPKRIAELESEDWDRVMNVNLKSAYLFCQAVWLPFVARRRGAIVNIASIMGLAGGVGAPAYCASKSALIMLARCLAKDGAPHGIRVNTVCPGYIDTPILERQLAALADPLEGRRQMLALQPSGRLGSPADIAHAVLFLASDDASYINGAALTVDGAVTATQID